ncbi:unnamed protein product, partial [Mesorhabditis belari]|uniref:F-box domain-containing protein n=1 Tax=Mesorhabditis belari TaxID=2138241 RepID=A0AAF3J7B3_9BILA
MKYLFVLLVLLFAFISIEAADEEFAGKSCHSQHDCGRGLYCYNQRCVAKTCARRRAARNDPVASRETFEITADYMDNTTVIDISSSSRACADRNDEALELERNVFPQTLDAYRIVDLPAMILIQILKHCTHEEIAEFSMTCCRAYDFIHANKRLICNRFTRGVLHHDKIMGVKIKHSSKAHLCLSLNDFRLMNAHFEDLVIMFPPDGPIDHQRTFHDWHVDQLTVRLCRANMPFRIRKEMFQAINALKYKQISIYSQVMTQYRLIFTMYSADYPGVFLQPIKTHGDKYNRIFVKMSCANERADDLLIAGLHEGKISVHSSQNLMVKLVFGTDQVQRCRMREKLRKHSTTGCINCEKTCKFPISWIHMFVFTLCSKVLF